MPSSLSWIDYDSEAQQRAQRILTLFKERDTRDELGLGPIRDGISDALFPGTSTIQTRLHYMLFIPWMYRALEDKHVPSSRIREYSRRDQLFLAQQLKENASDELGIIGGDVGDQLQRLPSGIYWAGLVKWGIRVYPGTEGQYQGALDDIYRRRKKGKASFFSAAEDGDDIGGLWEYGAHTFHSGLPEAPAEFPKGATFKLTANEARYLQERIRQSCTGSLLADLLTKPVSVSIGAPWEHPDSAGFRPEQRDLLSHGRLFSLVSHGAAILYNLMLAEMLDNEGLVSSHRDSAKAWLDQFQRNRSEVVRWVNDISAFWDLVRDQGHEINGRTEDFVEQWAAAATEYSDQLFTAKEPRRLVKAREIDKKKANSRFTNARVRDQWGGYSGTRPMVYRWPIVQTFINDMAGAFKK